MAQSIVSGLALLGLIAVSYVAFRWVEDRDRRIKEHAARSALLPGRREIAVIEERKSLSAGGIICLALMLVGLFVGIASYAIAASTFQAVQALTIMIVDILLFGLGVAMFQRRSYRVYSHSRAIPAKPDIKAEPHGLLANDR